jgi:hypothetical protein
VLYYAVLSFAVLCCALLYCAALCFTVLCCTALYCTVLHCALLYCAALRFTVLCCTVLRCYLSALYCLPASTAQQVSQSVRSTKLMTTKEPEEGFPSFTTALSTKPKMKMNRTQIIRLIWEIRMYSFCNKNRIRDFN